MFYFQLAARRIAANIASTNAGQVPMSAFGGKADIASRKASFLLKGPYVQKNYNFCEGGLEDSTPSEFWGWGGVWHDLYPLAAHPRP